MTLASTPIRRRFQRGSIARGAIVATALVGALGLQLAGPRLQGRLAAMAGIGWVAPGAAPRPSPALSAPCGSSSAAMRPCKVAAGTGAVAAPLL